jgi:DNA-directed RNA polymerase specialized sigma24 family protein
MELMNEIIDMTYRFAWTFLKRKGRTDIDHNDLAHDALVMLAKASPVPDTYIRRRVWLDVKKAFFEFYTNATCRKHNVLLDAVHAEFEMGTLDPDTVAAKDEFIRALKIVFRSQPTQCEILMLILSGKTIKEIAQMRGTSTKAVDQLKQKARKEIAAILGIAA